MPSISDIQALLDKADARFEAAGKIAELRTLRAYRAALDGVKAKIAAAWETSDAPTLSELLRYKRLASIETQVMQEIRALTNITVNLTARNNRRMFEASYRATGEAFRIGAAVDVAFDKVPKSAIAWVIEDNRWMDALKLNNARLLTDVEREFETVLRTNARAEVVKGLAQGDSYKTVTKAITERFNIAATRAKMITFTEMHKSHSKGRVEGMRAGAEAAERLGFKTLKVWKHNAVGVPRPEHVAAGQDGAPNHAVPVDQPFNVGGELLEAPGLGADPANNINCHCSAQFELVELEDSKKT